MKQILQNLKRGKTELVDVPEPGAKPGHVVIETSRSLLPAGADAPGIWKGKP